MHERGCIEAAAPQSCRLDRRRGMVPVQTLEQGQRRQNRQCRLEVCSNLVIDYQQTFSFHSTLTAFSLFFFCSRFTFKGTEHTGVCVRQIATAIKTVCTDFETRLLKVAPAALKAVRVGSTRTQTSEALIAR